MARIDPVDKRIRSGRGSDSGSSPDTTPRRPASKHIRSFSPTSDDGNLVIRMPDDDTPPPPDRPLIRQSLAFSQISSGSSGSTSSNNAAGVKTYEALSNPPAHSRQNRFLPGQGVALPPAPPPEKKKKTRTSRKVKEGYASQTSRFRLEPQNTYTAIMPLSQSSGPAYGEIYLQQLPTANEVSHSAPVSGSSVQVPSTNVALASAPQGKNLADLGNSANASDRTPSTGYHYENRRSNEILPVTHDQGQSYRSTNYGSDLSTVAPPSSSSTLGTIQSVKGDEGSKVGQRPLRMVTVLITDNRGGGDDFQLVEIKIPLKTADDPEDGFWADARDISEKLQASPGRIDGPAKVSSSRGQYRQIFLRVSADNVDQCESANINVKVDRTVELTVDDIGPPPRPKQKPSHSRSYSPEMPYTLQRRRYRDDYEAEHDCHDFSKKRRHSPSSEEEYSHSRYDDFRRGSSSTMASGSRSVYHEQPYPRDFRDPKKRTKRSRKAGSLSPGSDLETFVRLPPSERQYESPESDDEDSELEEIIVKSVDKIIQKEPGWRDFWRAKAMPGRAKDNVIMYGIVQPLMDKWVGKRIFRRSDHRIKGEHIIQALCIKDETFLIFCAETLELLKLYGPEGSRLRDARVIAALDDERAPMYNEKPMKRLIKLLREVDAGWKRDNPSNS